MKLYLVAGAVLVASVGANVLLFKHWQSTRDELRAETVRAEQLDGKLSAMHERIERAAAVRREGEQLIIEVQNAANKSEWGATAVPDDVVRVLCDNAHCARSSRVPTPND